jgi:hypothetical protein
VRDSPERIRPGRNNLGIDLAALIVAVVAAAVALMSLGWQVVAFVLTGPRVKVKLREAYRNPMTGERLVTTAEAIVGGVEKLNELGYSEHVLVVRVTNHGRSATTVERWNLVFGNGVIYVHPVADPTNPRTPTRLEPHTSTQYYTLVEWLQGYQAAFTKQDRRAKRVRAAVAVSGRERDRTSRYSYRVDASGLHEHGRAVLRRLAWYYRWVRAKLR